MIIGERQEMKSQDLKKFKSSAFLVKSNSAISMYMAKLEIANAELSLKLGRSVLIHTCARVKTIESIQAKCKKKGYDPTFECAMEKINDIIGVRGVCSFQDDVYRMAEVLATHQDLKIIKKKDYIQHPKNSGYRSLHLITEIPIYFQGEMEWIRGEIQLRTTAMDFWAGVDHQLRYKKGKKEAVLIGRELKEYSQVVAELDQKMVEMRERIDAI